MISYEYPLSERVRTLLRFEDLYERVAYFSSKSGAMEHHSALVTIFEILEVASRADLKSDLLLELERQKQSLDALRENPSISLPLLQDVLVNIDQIATRLFQSSGKVGQELRENDWLMAIKQRISIPGGVCEFDLPSYHFWLQKNPPQRQQDLKTWLQPFEPITEAVNIVLKLLRQSGKKNAVVARQGIFQQTMTGKVAQMIRIELSSDYICVPEISANKYALNIRFTHQEGKQRPKVVETDFAFDLTFCNL